MAKYSVDVRIVGDATVTIEAESQREAEDKADALVSHGFEPPAGWNFDSPEVTDIEKQ